MRYRQEVLYCHVPLPFAIIILTLFCLCLAFHRHDDDLFKVKTMSTNTHITYWHSHFFKLSQRIHDGYLYSLCVWIYSFFNYYSDSSQCLLSTSITYINWDDPTGECTLGITVCVGRRSLGLYPGERGVVLLPALRIQVTALLPVPYWLILHPWHTHATSFILLYTWEEERKGRKAEGTTLSHNTHSSVVQRSLTYPGYPGTQVLSTNCSTFKVVFPVDGCISCSSILVENTQSDFFRGKREVRIYWGTSGEVLFVHTFYICRGSTSWFDIP